MYRVIQALQTYYKLFFEWEDSDDEDEKNKVVELLFSLAIKRYRLNLRVPIRVPQYIAPCNQSSTNRY